MPEETTPDLGFGENESAKNKGGSGRSRSSEGYDPLPDSGIEYVFEALDQARGNDFEIPFFESDAETELSEPAAELIGADTGTAVSVETLFDVSTEREYVGDPQVEKEWFDSKSDAEDFADDNDLPDSNVRRSKREDQWYVTQNVTDLEGDNAVDRHITTEISYRINGYENDRIVETFGDDSYVRVGMGIKANHEDPMERARYVRFKVTESDKAEDRRRSAMLECEDVDYSNADHDEWMENAEGYDEVEETDDNESDDSEE